MGRISFVRKEQKRGMGWILRCMFRICAIVVALACVVFWAKGDVVAQVQGTGVISSSEDQDDLLVMPNPREDIINREQERQPVLPSDARSIHYRPQDNDVKLDPLNDGYQRWLESVRREQTNPDQIDLGYEHFVKTISVMLFSLGEKQLPEETKALLENIPPDALVEDVAKPLEPRHPVDIDHGDTVDPFPSEEQLASTDETIGADVGLKIDIKEQDFHSQKSLEMAYDASISGQIEGAIALYRRVLDVEPNNKQALFGLATAYHRNGQSAEAREAYIKLLSLDANNWSAMNNFLVLTGEEAPESALKELQRLEQLNPEFSPIPAQIGMVYIKLGRLDDAVKYLGRAVQLTPDNLAYRYNLAVLLDHLGYRQQAARLYRQLLQAGLAGKELPESSRNIQDRLSFIASDQVIKN